MRLCTVLVHIFEFIGNKGWFFFDPRYLQSLFSGIFNHILICYIFRFCFFRVRKSICAYKELTARNLASHKRSAHVRLNEGAYFSISVAAAEIPAFYSTVCFTIKHSLRRHKISTTTTVLTKGTKMTKSMWNGTINQAQM